MTGDVDPGSVLMMHFTCLTVLVGAISIAAPLYGQSSAWQAEVSTQLGRVADYRRLPGVAPTATTVGFEVGVGRPTLSFGRFGLAVRVDRYGFPDGEPCDGCDSPPPDAALVMARVERFGAGPAWRGALSRSVDVESMVLFGSLRRRHPNAGHDIHIQHHEAVGPVVGVRFHHDRWAIGLRAEHLVVAAVDDETHPIIGPGRVIMVTFPHVSRSSAWWTLGLSYSAK